MLTDMTITAIDIKYEIACDRSIGKFRLTLAYAKDQGQAQFDCDYL